jgi:hypothetical protein
VRSRPVPASGLPVRRGILVVRTLRQLRAREILRVLAADSLLAFSLFLPPLLGLRVARLAGHRSPFLSRVPAVSATRRGETTIAIVIRGGRDGACRRMTDTQQEIPEPPGPEPAPAPSPIEDPPIGDPPPEGPEVPIGDPVLVPDVHTPR